MARPGEFAAGAPEHAEAALRAALADLEGEPRCAECPNEADFFLYEPERVAKFVCWEHVSPISAVVEAAEGDGTVDRPLAVALSEEFS